MPPIFLPAVAKETGISLAQCGQRREREETVLAQPLQFSSIYFNLFLIGLIGIEKVVNTALFYSVDSAQFLALYLPRLHIFEHGIRVNLENLGHLLGRVNFFHNC